MTAFVTALRWDIVLQARNGFYWASAFVILVIGGLLLALPEAARANEAAWVPAIIAVNLQITTFFFVAGLMLLERDEGTLAALAVSPFSPGAYLATRTVTLTALGGRRDDRRRLDCVQRPWIVAARPLRIRRAGCDLHGSRRRGGGSLHVCQCTAAPGIACRDPPSAATPSALWPRAAPAVPDPSDRTAPFLAPSRIRRRDSWRASSSAWSVRLFGAPSLSMGPEPREPVDA